MLHSSPCPEAVDRQAWMRTSFPSDCTESRQCVNEALCQTHVTEWVCPRTSKNKSWWSAESKTRKRGSFRCVWRENFRILVRCAQQKGIIFLVPQSQNRMRKRRWGSARRFLYSEVQLSGGKSSQDERPPAWSALKMMSLQVLKLDKYQDFW